MASTPKDSSTRTPTRAPAARAADSAVPDTASVEHPTSLSESGPTPPGVGAPWFSGGLQFSCHWQTCSACCEGEGYVWVTASESRRLADQLELSPAKFRARYTRKAGNRRRLKDKPDRRACVFVSDDGPGCMVYEARPTQCRAYPFWPEIVDHPDTWLAERAYCPGVNCGKRLSAAEVMRRRTIKRPPPPAHEVL